MISPQYNHVEDVALVGADKAAAFGDMSVSWWNGQVATGRAPAPVVRRPRCTRWRLADVVVFWREFAETGAADAASAERVAAQARRAREAAKVKRRRTAEVAA